MDPSLKKRLDTLQHYLSNLPDILPLPGLGLANYNFDLFDISAEDIEDYSEVSAVNRQLEISFGSRHDGPVLFTERGPALVQVVETKDIAPTIMARCNPLLVTTHPKDALMLLKEQLNSYGKGLEPFNRRFRPQESLYSWWEQVQQDEFGGVLGALAMKNFAAVPISMVDERTMSMIRWLNSPRRSRQDIATLQDHVKIRQWHRTGPGAKHMPLLKWCDVESTLGKRNSSMLVDKTLPPAGRAAPRPRLASESGPEQDSGGAATSIIDDGNDWLNEPHQLDPGAVGAERHVFTLGGRTDINLSSPYLRDILSDTNVAQTHVQDTVGTSIKDPRGSAAAAMPPPADTEWESWE
ncbi:hypothetical protein BU15DRAFT_73385 [Melanogaster broomeanus]|nr:hypothetical protein BU15DRAFT_73385 [Melanogaster broomeanus]